MQQPYMQQPYMQQPNMQQPNMQQLAQQLRAPDHTVLQQQQARGITAQDELNQLRGGPQAQMMYDRANAEMPQVTGNEFSARQPNIMENIASMVSRKSGRDDIARMKTQADALRGEVAQGRQAEMQQQDAVRREAFEQNARMAKEAREERMRTYKGNFQTWENNKGNTVTFAMTGNGPVDSQGNRVNLDGYKPLEAEKGLSSKKLFIVSVSSTS